MSVGAFKELIVIQESRKQVKAGNVFVFQPKPNTYFWGKVIKAKIHSKEPFCDGQHLVYIFNVQTPDYEHIPKLEVDSLLFAPIITNAKGWRDGYYLTVANQPLTQEEKSLSFGFWDDLTNKFVNEHGDVIATPKLKANYSLYSYGYVGYEIHRLLYGGVREDSVNPRSIFDEDLAIDMGYDLDKLLKSNSAEQAFAKLRKMYQTSFTDCDEGPLAMVILAKLQLDKGKLEDDVKMQAIEAIDSGAVFRLFENSSPEVISYNQKVFYKLRESLISNTP